jgi:iron complex outermembrane receptor protein
MYRQITYILSGGAALFLAMPAMAQSAPNSAGRSAQGVEEVIVTARKRDERLLDVPVAVSALSSQQIERYSIATLSDIARETPQLVISEVLQSSGGVINLRGIGAGTSNPSTEQSVTPNLDGIQVSYGSAIRLGQLDLQRVEVLKGPQALFYGKNSPGGIISLISNDPGKTFEAQLRTGYEFEAKKKFAEAILSGPLSDNIGARLVGYYGKEDGWFKNIAAPIPGISLGRAKDSIETEEYFLRGTLTYNSPSNNFRAKAKMNYGYRNRPGNASAWVSQPIYCPTGVAQNSRGNTTDCKLDRYYSLAKINPAAAALDPDFGDGTPFMKNTMVLTSLSMDYDLTPELTLSSVTGYYDFHDRNVGPSTFTAVPSISIALRQTINSFSQELRLGSNYDGPLNFLAGGFYQEGNFKFRQPVAIELAPAAPFASTLADFSQDTTAYSAFGQLRYKLTSEFEVSAGGRYSHERKSLGGFINKTTFTIQRPSRAFNNFSPEVTLTYKPDRDLTAYASYRQGFTSGGYNTNATPLRSAAFPTAPIKDLSFAPTTARGGEVGLKGYMADHQVRFDMAAYYYKYRNLQLSKFDAATVTTLTQNAGAAKVRGAEMSLIARPNSAPDFEVRSSLAYNKSNYTNFIGGCYTGQSVAQGCNLVPNNPALAATTFGTTANPYTSQNQAGQALNRAPKWSLTFGATYEHEFSDTLGMSVSFDTSYSSSYITQAEANPLSVQKGFWYLDGNISLYRQADRAWQVALIGRNLTNKLVVVSGSVTPFSGAATGTTAAVASDLIGGGGPPRSIMLQLTVKNGLFGG